MGGYSKFRIPVANGLLAGGCWGESGPVIVASHGLTATHQGFAALADQLITRLGTDFRLIAPDHRGRGHSRDVGPPYGMQAHAQDINALLDHFGVEQADVLLGHSMGGFVAAVAAAEYPERFRSVLLVDGGLPSIDGMPQGVGMEELIEAIVGPSMQRLDMCFESLDAHREFWRQHPAFAANWSEYIERYADYDLIGSAPQLRPSTVKAAIIADVETQLLTDLVPDSLRRLAMPVRLLQAPRGVIDADPLYTATVVHSWARRMVNFSHVMLDEVNHFTVLLSRHGAAQVADEVRKMILLEELNA